MTRRPKPRRVGLLPAREIRLYPGDDAAAAQHFACSVSMVALIRTGKRRPDAGGPIRNERPARGESTACTVKLPEALLARIDRARGKQPRGRWMREAAEMRLATPTDPPI